MLEALTICGKELKERKGLENAKDSIDSFRLIQADSQVIPPGSYITMSEEYAYYGFTKCPYKGVIEKPYNGRNYKNHAEYAEKKWIESFEKLRNNYILVGDNETQAEDKARRNAKGHEDCSPNFIGGTLFMFLIMTTIGYGEYTVVTDEGRAIVYTLGFLTILIFGTSMGLAGSVVLDTFDDFAFRRNYSFLTKGIPSVVFWFCMFYATIGAFGCVAFYYTKQKLEGNLTTIEAIWFCFM